MQKSVKIYFKPTCPYCAKALDLLENTYKLNNIEKIDISGNDTLKEQMVAISGRSTVPQIFIADYHVGGCDDLMQMHAIGRLKNLLES